MSRAPEPVGNLQTALAHAERLLPGRPDLCAEQAMEILKVVADEPSALFLLARAERALGRPAAALAHLEALVAGRPGWAAALCEIGLALRSLGRGSDALRPLRQAVALKPDLGAAWLALGDFYTDTGDVAAADAAYARHVQCSIRDPRLLAAGAALYANRLPEAETLLRAQLLESPTDVAALRMLAEVAARLRRYADAETLLRRCVELAPSFMPARHNLALVLHRQNRAAEALEATDALLALEPRNVSFRNLKAAILGTIGEYEASLELYRGVLAEYPDQARVWMSFGHALKTSGRERESVSAYERSIALLPDLGEAYWSLANLKTYRFTAGQLEAMNAALAREELDVHERLHFHFAMGKALEDERRYAEAFAHYDAGNALRRAELRHDAADHQARVHRSKTLFTRDFLRDREGVGHPDPAPIFIVGLPRAGSTLLEQILASHSQVEGTMELPDLVAMARRLAASGDGAPGGDYPGVLARLSGAQWRALGEEYIARTRVYRKTSAPHFIDKMPNNFMHVGMILIALPRAKIIDARRHPLACCFSGYKQHFAMGQLFTYDLEDLGRYYRDYVELMAHVDAVAPGRVHRVIYERLVEDTEAEVRALLDYCGLTFEPACLRFYDNARPVRTASSEQVRRPIYREGIDQWRHFEPWLGPLKKALAGVLEAYPGAPPA